LNQKTRQGAVVVENASEICAAVRFPVYNYKIYFRSRGDVLYIRNTMAKAHRLAIDLPPPLLEYVKALAERRGLTMSGAIVLIVGDHMDSASAKGAEPKPKMENEK
jgi:hypothetical protein